MQNNPINLLGKSKQKKQEDVSKLKQKISDLTKRISILNTNLRVKDDQIEQLLQQELAVFTVPIEYKVVYAKGIKQLIKTYITNVVRGYSIEEMLSALEAYEKLNGFDYKPNPNNKNSPAFVEFLKKYYYKQTEEDKK